jgi:hypothetical protein
MDNFFAIFILILLLINLVASCLVAWLLNNLRQFNADVNKDFVEAVSVMMKINTSGFKDTFEALDSMQKWNEKCFEKTIEIQNENAKKIFENLVRQQNFMGKMAEQLGYRPRTDLEV